MGGNTGELRNQRTREATRVARFVANASSDQQTFQTIGQELGVIDHHIVTALYRLPCPTRPILCSVIRPLKPAMFNHDVVLPGNGLDGGGRADLLNESREWLFRAKAIHPGSILFVDIQLSSSEWWQLQTRQVAPPRR